MQDEMRLPCGCVTGIEDDTFVIVSCSKGRDCEWVQYVLSESEAQGKPMTVVG